MHFWQAFALCLFLTCFWGENVKITCLVENTCKRGEYESEHGLSLYLETNGHKILFDMGQTELFERNAKRLGIDLSDVDMAIVSHGHYDHGGGLKRFLEINNDATVYLNQYAFGNYYNGTEKYIGLDHSLKENSRIIFAENECYLDNGLALYSCNNKIRHYNLGSFGLTSEKDGVFENDDFRHEQYLLVEEGGKRFLISGCSHRGIMDITEWFLPDVLVGGFHFSNIPTGDALRKYAEFLDKFSTDFYTCHCTGIEQYEFMKKYMNRLNYISSGDVFEI